MPLSEQELRALQELHAATSPPASSQPVSPQNPPLATSPIETLGATTSASDGPIQPAGDNIEWLTGALSPKLPGSRRFWICLVAEGCCVGGVVWGADRSEGERLAAQAQEIAALAHAWSLALRMAQVRESSRTLAEELASANRRLSTAQDVFLRTRALMTV